MKFSLIKKFIRYMCVNNLLNFLSDEIYLKLKYWACMDGKLNLINPQSFNEKLQWLKLNDRNPLYTKLVDKYEVREYIKKEIGEEYLVPIYGVWEKFDNIDFEKLPDQFVIKCTHDSGGIVICKDKKLFDKKKAKKKIEKLLKRNFYYIGREWPYKNIKPRIIVEKYLEELNGELTDYKFLCFNGKAKLIEIHQGRFRSHTQDFYDIEWNKTNITQGPVADEDIPKPQNLEKMIELSEKLAQNFIHVRIDWYNINGKIIFGEITLYDGSGFYKFDLEEYNKKIGSWLQL